ncbi:hypothetical protein AVEN_269696-1 [Araneus ventricosus]|uniref:Uncharacterized protein n=1 Tax=Araneus ventricosus TaxID=182803 RepID=A0A4Y2CIK9_ARAVE|nr:hypothetical protein AVEN_269696-1 [Araneus ventricosus]
MKSQEMHLKYHHKAGHSRLLHYMHLAWSRAFHLLIYPFIQAIYDCSTPRKSLTLPVNPISCLIQFLVGPHAIATGYAKEELFRIEGIQPEVGVFLFFAPVCGDTHLNELLPTRNGFFL